jgi:hypothetical protein
MKQYGMMTEKFLCRIVTLYEKKLYLCSRNFKDSTKQKSLDNGKS